MAGLRETPLQPIQVESGKLLQPAGSAEEVRNFRRTSQGTLTAVRGPAPLIPDYGNGYPSWGNPHGICHARLIRGRRDVLLIHTGTNIYIQDGPTRSRVSLVATSGALLNTTLPNDQAARPPTAFLTTPQGIVIMPYGSRPIFYDGEFIAYGGFEQAPNPPVSTGPGITDNDFYGSTYRLYHEDFGHGRLGTVSNDAGDNSLLRGAYQHAIRWKDRWGNFSPWSARSNTMAFKRIQPSPSTDPAEDVRVVAIVTNLAVGPAPTKYRDVARTKDLEHAGTSSLFLLPMSVGGTPSNNRATLKDNCTRAFIDNVPDTWLSIPVDEADPMPQVRFGRLAFGRAWYVPESHPGRLIYTFPGRWLTPVKDGFIEPDPSGGEITGAWAYGGVMLVWTRTTTYVIEPYQDASPGYRTYMLHPTVGCAAPDSITSLDDGSIVWLSADGFYRYDGDAIVNISDPIQRTVEGLNRARLIQATARFDPESKEYRCWVPDGGSTENTLCLVFDAVTGGWRRRDGESLRAVCVTQDHRRLMIGTGYVTPAGGASTSGVWVLDRHSGYFTEPSRTYLVRTCWFATTQRVSPVTVFIHGVESRTGSHTLNSYRDYRSQEPTDNGRSFSMRDPGTTSPSTWGSTGFAASARWVRSRPIKPKADLHIPSAEAYQVEITSTIPYEYIGLRFGEIARPESGRTERA